MGTTTNWALPYPNPGANTNVPGDMQALANAVDVAQFTKLRPSVQYFTPTISCPNGSYVNMNPDATPVNSVNHTGTFSRGAGTNINFAQPGVYVLSAMIYWPSDTGVGSRLTTLYINGGELTRGLTPAAFNTVTTVCATAWSSIPGTFSMAAWQNSGAALNVYGYVTGVQIIRF
jgi:hypothetical protein